MKQIEDQRDITDMVKEFYDTFGITPDPVERRAVREKLVHEETREVLEAVANLIKELVDLAYVAEGLEQDGGDPRDIANFDMGPDWLGDIVYAIPTSVLLAALRRVHYSNMSKLGPNGEVLRREDGKILKGPNYQPPDLSDLVR